MRNSHQFWLCFVCVSLVHALFIFRFFVQPLPSNKIQTPQKHLLVKTITLQPRATENFVAEVTLAPKVEEQIVPKEPVKPKPSSPKPLPKPLPKKEIPKKEPVAVPNKKPVEVPNKKPMPSGNSQQKQQIAKAKEALAKISSSQALVEMTPHEIANLPTLGEGSEASYQAIMIQQLQNQLKLPEYGQVIISITVNKYGKILKSSIVNSLSKKNEAYVDAEIKKISFPPFGSLMPNRAEESFTITLVHKK